MEDFYRKELLSIQNIIQGDDGYELQNNYYESDGRIIPVIPWKNRDNHNCSLCMHFHLMSGDTGNGYCDIYNKLLNLPKNCFAWSSLIDNCAAYNKVEKMNIINSIDEMITFIEKTENFFGCQEDYESYFGFERNLDEETGDILETVRDYHNRGGKFTNIPTEYPCVIRFDWNCEDDLEWIYIGQ